MAGPAIELTGVRKAYGGTVALGGADLAVAPGSFVSLIGPSGCGKSTLLRLAAGLEAPDAGSVLVLGGTPQAAAAAKRIGFVPQSPSLLPWLSVLRNVTLPRKVNRGAARRGAAGRGEPPDPAGLLRRAGLGDVLDRLPAQLSGGMQQRVAIVRALALAPDVLLMDEPFSALDEMTRESLQDQLLGLWALQRATALFVTHSVAEAVRLSDRVLVMAAHPGRIVAHVDIDLPRPRDAEMLASGPFHDYEDRVRGLLRDAWSAPDAA
ncbi:MAG TPA: ABC transporter ATP-binding protein [Trebonia sp.]|nr:ABC transporter ATP-binding protein [Trebonia sp.]